MNKVDSIRAMRERLLAGRGDAGAARPQSAGGASVVRKILEKHERKASQIIAILHDMQAVYHYLHEQDLRLISRELDIPLTRLCAIVTFYKAFRLVPRGRHEVSLCMGTACHVRGAMRVKDAIERGLGIKAGGTTDDMRFSFETVRCLGCCGQAPVMMVDEALVTKLDHLTVGTTLEKCK